MYDRILLPLDGSKTAEAAIPHAMVMANAFNSAVTLFYVVEPSLSVSETDISAALSIPTPPATAMAPDEAEIHDAEEYLRSVADTLQHRGIRVDTLIKYGTPGSEICDYLQSGYIDMIVMTTHGRSGFQRFVYGSVAEYVLHNTFTPILLIRIQPD